MAHRRSAEHKQPVRAWVRGLAEKAGAKHPEELAQQLTALIDGVLSAGTVEPGLGFAASAKAAARVLVENS